jgi:TonB family protein
MRKSTKKESFIYKPVYPGGIKALNAFLDAETQYPKDALDNKIEGTVTLKFDVDRDGVVLSVKVVKGVGHGLNEEAKRLVKKLRYFVDKNNIGGHLVFHLTLNITFRLPLAPTLAVDLKTEPEPELQPEQPINQPIQMYSGIVYQVVTTPKPESDTSTKSKTKPSVTYTIKWNSEQS